MAESKGDTATDPAVDEAAKPTVQIFPLKPNSMTLMTYDNQVHNAIVPPDVTVDQLGKSEFWRLCAKNIRVFDEIRVIHEHHAFFARLLVTFSDGMNIVVKILEAHDLEGMITKGVTDDYFVEMRGQKLWCIIRREDGTEIKTKMRDRGAAYKELDEYLRTIGQ